MAYSYVPCDRDQLFLLPTSMREWLPEGHLAWFLIDVVAKVDTSRVHVRAPQCWSGSARLRPGHDADAADVLVLPRGACLATDRAAVRERRRLSGDLRQPAARSRGGERGRVRRRAGAVRSGGADRPGRDLHRRHRDGADAARDANRGAEAIRAELERILVEAGAPDTAEDAHLGLARGDELPAELASPISRLARLERALAEIEKLEEAAAARGQRPKGRQPAPDQELERAEARLQTARATAATAEPAKAPLANTTDPDSRIMKTPGGCIQGYNVQAAVNEHLTLDEPPTHQRHIRGHGIEAGQHPLLNANVLEGANYHTNHPGAPIQLYLRNSVRYLVDKSRMKGTIVNCKAPHAPSSLNFRPGTSAR